MGYLWEEYLSMHSASLPAAEGRGEVTLEFVAPARVNLLGEHTDYTGGLVLPMAIPFFTVASIARSEDPSYTFISELFAESRTIGLEDQPVAEGNWSDYPVGVLQQLQARDISPPPFRLSFRGDIPFGAGLSSSASIEVATAIAVLAMSNHRLAAEEIALLCQRAENIYVKSPCGIMDQFVITSAKAGHALLLDTRSLKYENIPVNLLQLGDTCIVICNSMVKHSIASGDYGLRRREVEAGQHILREAFPRLRDLGDATMEELVTCEGDLSRESFQRCRHIISENARVREAKAGMLTGDAVRLGRLMMEAHASQRDDFECSCEEIDFLVAAAAALPGCFGARMTGGGFGGCTVNLVARGKAEAFAAALKSRYHERFGVTAESYVCEAVDGAIARIGDGGRQAAKA
jgi:galactokinase